MTDRGNQTVRRTTGDDAAISDFDVGRLDRPLRRLSKDEKAMIVVERHRRSGDARGAKPG